jgi:hypothetical protein
MTSGQSVRMLVPLGLHICPPFYTISKTAKEESFLPPARTVIEDETRRNVFWLAYAADRTTGIDQAWSSGIDDDDIAQLLPVKGDEFDRGVRHLASIHTLSTLILCNRSSSCLMNASGHGTKGYFQLTLMDTLTPSPFILKGPVWYPE